MEVFRNYINGEFVDGADSFLSINPATGRHWAKIPACNAKQVDAAVRAARQAFRSRAWIRTTASQRGKLLLRIADLIEQHAERFAELDTLDSGKTLRETSAQSPYIAEYYRYFAGLADKLEGAYLPIDHPDSAVWLRREPKGVVAAIVPWNSPLFLSAVKLGPALAAGCTVVLKASEDAPAPMLEFAKLIAEADILPGVVNIICGFGDDCGKPLSSHPDVDHIAFTGGPETAKHIVRNSANSLASTSLELGGKSPFIVFEDCDVESAVNAQIAAIFLTGGQSCVAGSRLIVARKLKEQFLEQLKQKAQGIVIGDPLDLKTDIGPLCTERQRNFIAKMVSDSVAAGAELICGGEFINRPGYYFQPTILDCSKHVDAPSVSNELFGPVLSVLEFDEEDEALKLANQTPYGLAAGVFTTNLARAHRLSSAIKAGAVWINTYRNVSPMVPFGGFGWSGHGREGGIESVLAYMSTKSVWLNTSDKVFTNPFEQRG